MAFYVTRGYLDGWFQNSRRRCETLLEAVALAEIYDYADQDLVLVEDENSNDLHNTAATSTTSKREQQQEQEGGRRAMKMTPKAPDMLCTTIWLAMSQCERWLRVQRCAVWRARLDGVRSSAVG